MYPALLYRKVKGTLVPFWSAGGGWGYPPDSLKTPFSSISLEEKGARGMRYQYETFNR